ncbi:hypothetical protein AB4144_30845, partial [Rhizobiaceae sp. 2RAB30]
TDPEATRRVAQMVGNFVGAGKVNGQMERQFGSEDFACFLNQRPGTFTMLGNANPGTSGPSLHTPGYDFNDDALAYGITYWVALAEASWDID